MTIRLRRSALYMPASNLKAIAKARTLPCDAIVLDLEDAVAPDLKDLARSQAVEAVMAGGFGGRELIVRANGLDTPWGADDLVVLAKAAPDAVLVPKVNGADDIAVYDEALSNAPSNTRLWAMIETTQSILHLETIAAASRTSRLSLFVMGTNDLAKEMRAELTPARTPFLGFLAQAVVAARAYGLGILDGVYNATDDDPGLAQQCRQAREFGFDGKTLIHPRQIDICNRSFSPGEDEIAWARAVIEAFDLEENREKGAIRVQGRMVERLHLDQARETVLLNEAVGQGSS
jgi:citrate lyase subunit beta/citryl-CoA lyase